MLIIPALEYIVYSPRYMISSLRTLSIGRFNRGGSCIFYRCLKFRYNSTSGRMVENKTDNLKLITRAQLEANNGLNGNRLWICLNGFVYDVTEFKEHPGGYDAFEEVSGTDATEHFEEVGHSATAHELMAEYLEGKLAVEDNADK